ncbi:MAG: hypothetical protein IJT03_03700 [Clostridia bacterium]|nr:hypothetical protein [Clostridia bacterium]
MSFWEVRDYLGQLVDIGGGSSEEISDVCRTSLKEILTLLKPGADGCDMRVIAAAAAGAYYKLMLKRYAAASEASTDEFTSFKAGDISISGRSSSAAKDAQVRLDKAERLLETAMVKLAPLCEDNSFEFRQVGVKKK